MKKLLAITADWLAWLDEPRADGADYLRALAVVYAPVGAEDDSLIGQDSYSADRTGREFC